MLRVTKLTDYAVVLLTRFARDEGDRLHTAPDLAAETRIPLPMVSKILKTLARKGLLVSHRGVKGGYTLARPAVAISIAEVIELLEGPISMTECVGPERSHCQVECHCPVRGHWSLINSAVQHALESISLSDMARPAPEPISLAARASVARGGAESVLTH